MLGTDNFIKPIPAKDNITSNPPIESYASAIKGDIAVAVAKGAIDSGVQNDQKSPSIVDLADRVTKIESKKSGIFGIIFESIYKVVEVAYRISTVVWRIIKVSFLFIKPIS